VPIHTNMRLLTLFTMSLPSLLYAATVLQEVGGVQEKALEARQVSLAEI
jgi:hypothetical protein